MLIDERPTRANVFPISIDVDDVASRARKGHSSIPGRRLVESLRGRRLIIGVDRLDYSKGLTERFRAFERLLVNYPELRQAVIFMQVAPPSRGDVPEYKGMRRELNAVAGEINGGFAEYDWVPIRYLNKGYARTAIVGFPSVAEVGFVTPLRDGMNLVAKEFVAAQDPDSPGVLLLSELAVGRRDASGDLDGARRAQKTVGFDDEGDLGKRHSPVAAPFRRRASIERELISLNCGSFLPRRPHRRRSRRSAVVSPSSASCAPVWWD